MGAQVWEHCARQDSDSPQHTLGMCLSDSWEAEWRGLSLDKRWQPYFDTQPTQVSHRLFALECSWRCSQCLLLGIGCTYSLCPIGKHILQTCMWVVQVP